MRVLSLIRTLRPTARISSYTIPRRLNSTSLQPPTGAITPEVHEPRLSLTFTCTASDCNHRSTHQFTKAAYERGIVLIECPKCKNRHLIADNLGWFKEVTKDGQLKTIEDVAEEKGEKVVRGRITGDKIEYYGDNTPS